MASNVDSSVVPGLRLIDVTDGWAMGELVEQHCIVAVWRGQPTSAALELRGGELIKLAERHPKHCALIEVVESTSKPPSDETRKRAMEAFRNLADNLSCIAFTVEGTEMRSALTRAIITGMLFFVKQPQPTKVFRDIGEMLAWVRARIGTDRPAFENELKAAIEHLRSLITARAAS